jgi:hypothetical protein
MTTYLFFLVDKKLCSEGYAINAIAVPYNATFDELRVLVAEKLDKDVDAIHLYKVCSPYHYRYKTCNIAAAATDKGDRWYRFHAICVITRK